ncbi:MAG TPA: hypothetical protein VH040_11235, partial [Usitatibacter sp.]|nr:hypothetical protein [Usitatibacter sp.]
MAENQVGANPIVDAGPSAVQTRHVRVTQCTVRPNPDFPQPQPGAFPIFDGSEFHFETGFAKDAGDNPFYVGKLLAEMKDGISYEKPPPYFFRIEVEGFFQLMVP